MHGVKTDVHSFNIAIGKKVQMPMVSEKSERLTDRTSLDRKGNVGNQCHSEAAPYGTVQNNVEKTSCCQSFSTLENSTGSRGEHAGKRNASRSSLPSSSPSS